MKLPQKGLIKKIFLGISVLLFITSLSFPSFVHSKYTPIPPDTNVFTKYKEALESGDTTNLQQWGLYNIDYLALGLNRIITGVPQLTNEQVNNGGVIGIFASLVDGMYQQKPVSSGQYLAYLGEKMQIAKPVYAQGEGWKFLSPILNLWVGVRNVAYLFFIVIFVAVGFMIMLRQKIDSQTVVSVQNALPKIIIALIFVTFSFAICGFIVDLLFLFNELLHSIFASIMNMGAPPALGPPGSGPKGFSYNPLINPFDVASNIIGIVTASKGSGLFGFLKTFIDSIGDVFKGQFASVFSLTIGFVILTTVIKIFLTLLGRYVTLIIYPIFSPLIILFGSLPGQKDHLPRFLKSYLAAALTFPATVLVLNLAAYFFFAASEFKLGHNFMVFPPIAPFDLPVAPPPAVAVSLTTDVLLGFVGVGILMLASKIPEMIDDALSVKSEIGASLGAETGGALRRIPIIGSMMG